MSRKKSIVDTKISTADTPGERLKLVRIHLGLTQAEFGNPLNIAQSTISSLEKGIIEMTKIFAAAFENQWLINSDWLLTGKGEPFIHQKKIQKISEKKTDYFSPPRIQSTPDGSLIIPKSLLPESFSTPKLPEPAYKTLPIPLIDLPAAASFPGRIVHDQIIDTVHIPAPLLPRGAQNMTLSIVKISGNSMHPTIPDSSFVLLRHDSIDPTKLHKKVIAARINSEEVTIKRLFINPYAFELRPDNPEHQSHFLPLHAQNFIIAIAIRSWQKIP